MVIWDFFRLGSPKTGTRTKTIQGNDRKQAEIYKSQTISSPTCGHLKN